MDPLAMYLIGEHHFFEGKKTSYQLNPNMVCDVLEQKPENEYPKENITVKHWKFCTISNTISSNSRKKLINTAEVTYRVHNKFFAVFSYYGDCFNDFILNEDEVNPLKELSLHILADEDYERKDPIFLKGAYLPKFIPKGHTIFRGTFEHT